MKKLIFPIALIGFAFIIAWAVFTPIKKQEDWKVKNLPPGICIVTDGEGNYASKATTGMNEGLVYDAEVLVEKSYQAMALKAWRIYEGETNDAAQPKVEKTYRWLECGQTNRPPVPGETTHDRLEFWSKLPEWTTNSIPPHKAGVFEDGGKPYLVMWRTNQTINNSQPYLPPDILQIGASPDRLQITRLSDGRWHPTNFVVETIYEPVVTNDGTNWQITFKEGK